MCVYDEDCYRENLSDVCQNKVKLSASYDEGNAEQRRELFAASNVKSYYERDNKDDNVDYDFPLFLSVMMAIVV